MPHQARIPFPHAVLGVRVAGDRLVGIDFLPPDTPPLAPTHPVACSLLEQLEAYLRDPWQPFHLPLAPSGTAFRLRVWGALLEIPCGQVITYGELARRVGSVPRAVGQALGDNPLPILLPCHRVVAAGGGLGGFNHQQGGFSLEVKRWLLRHEGGM